MNRATPPPIPPPHAGEGWVGAEQAEDEGLEPTKEWVKDLCDEILGEEFSSPDLELAWLDEDEADPKGMEAVLEGRVKLGAVTLNEMRNALGLDPYTNAAADRAMVLTATGYVPIEANASSSPAGLTHGSMRPLDPMDCRIAPGDDALFEKYSPDQPRVPAGNPHGGEWTSEGGSGSASDSTATSGAAADGSSNRGAQFAALDTGTRTDASTPVPGVQYAAGRPQVVINPSALTGIQQVDDTTKRLGEILADTIDELGVFLKSPQYYGILVHDFFAVNVLLAGIQGIGLSDVEASFQLPPGYDSAKNSVKPDVVLRNYVGDIIAIYDVKTGDEGVDPSRERELRAATGVGPDVPVIVLHLRSLT